MKFYYEGKLVRTSKTHEYKFAAIDVSKADGEKISALKCSATHEGAKSEIDRKRNNALNAITHYEQMIKAIENGYKHMWAKECGHAYKIDLTKYSIDELRSYIDSERKYLDYIQMNFKVVQLEAKSN